MAIKNKTELKLKLRKNANFLAFIFLFAFTSCSQVRIHSASSRYISPEAAGKTLNGEIELQQQVGTQGRITLESNQIDNPMQLKNTISPLGTGLNLGILEKIDFIGYGRTDGPPLYGVKVQLIGDARDKAKKGNFSVALTAGMGNIESNFTNSELLTSASTKAKVDQSLTDFSLIIGLRIDNDVLLYTSVQKGTHKVKMNIESTEASLDGKEINLETDLLGASLGLMRYFESYMVKFEASAQQLNWTNNKETTYGYLGVSVGRYW